MIRVRNWPWIIHACDRHVWRITRRVWRIDGPGGIDQPVVHTVLVGVGTGNLDAVEVAERNRDERNGKLLAIVRSCGVEFRRSIVQDHARVVRRDRGLGEDEEVCRPLHLVAQSDFLAIAQVLDSTREWRYLLRSREQGEEIRHCVRRTDAGRRLNREATRTEVSQTRTGATQVRGGVLWVVGVVVRI